MEQAEAVANTSYCSCMVLVVLHTTGSEQDTGIDRWEDTAEPQLAQQRCPDLPPRVVFVG
jgi:hypothetical protein